MFLDGKPLDEIVETDLERLVDDQVSECKTIEYKRGLPGDKASHRKEFLFDLSSLANALGGYLFFGIASRNGVPTSIDGVEIASPDAEILRLENIARDGIAPRIPGLETAPVPLSNGRHVIIMHVPRSFAKPHMITFQDSNKFYSRNSAGKYLLDVGELRAAFALGEAIAERIRRFRLERLGMILSGDTPVPMQDVGKVVFHMVPLNAFDPSTRLDLSNCDQNREQLVHLYGIITDYYYNLDGFLTVSEGNGFAQSYLQMFRNGIIEAVVTSFISNDREGNRIIHAGYEQEIIKEVPRFINAQRTLGVEPPVFLMLSLVNVSGCIMYHSKLEYWHGQKSRPIERDIVPTPEVILDTFDVDPSSLLQPAFDTVWNASGWRRSMNYNEEGHWAPHN